MAERPDVREASDADALRRPEVSRNLSRKTAAGMRWSYLAAGSSAAVQVGYVAAMSRLLDPVDFGLMAMAQIAVNFGLFFSRMGLTQTIIQKDDVTGRDVRITATTSVMLGALFAVGVALAAPAVAAVYDEPDVVPVVRALAVTFLLLGFGITSQALLRRQLRFREIGIIAIVATFAQASVGVATALAGAGVYSLVAATVAGNATTSGLVYWRSRHSLRPLLVWEEARSLYASGVRFSALRFTEFIGKNLDTLAVGRYLTAATTGVYSRIYTLVDMPLSQHLSLAFAKVLFPSFAAIQNERDRLRRAARSALMIASLVLMPAAAGMVAAAPDIVGAVLGSKFTSGTPLVPFFAVSATLYVLSHLAQIMGEATGELDRTIGVQVSAILALVAGLTVAVGRDVRWFAAALVVSELVRHVLYLRLLSRILGTRVLRILSVYGPSLVAAAVVGGAIAGVRTAVVGTLPIVGVLLVDIAVGGLTLLLTIRLLPFPWVRRELRQRIRAIGLARGPLRRPIELVVGSLGGGSR